MPFCGLRTPWLEGEMGGYRALSVKRVVLSLLLVATAILPGGGTGIARAAEAQCGPYSPTVRYFDGFDKKTSETYLSWGVSADITVRSTNLCTSNLNGSQNIVVTWSMITAHNGDGWAQTGYHRAAGDLTHHFWQWKQCLSALARMFDHVFRCARVACCCSRWARRFMSRARSSRVNFHSNGLAACS